MRSRYLLPFLLLLASLSIAVSQDVTPSVESILKSDGSLDLDRGFEGALSIKGWRMIIGADGGPRFVREDGSPPALMSADDHVEGDEFWDDRFGPPGVDGPVHALYVYRGVVYVGGRFLFAGSALANNIARWDGANWSTMETGVSGPVFAITARADMIIVGGGFTSAGPEVARNIAQWDVTTEKWSRLGSDYEGVNDTVHALLTVGADVYIGGRFIRSFAGSPNINLLRIARWNGARWSAVGPGFNNTVRALAAVDTVVFAGGSFTQSGTTPALRIAQLDRAALTWSQVGDGFNGEVRALFSNGTTLWAGGAFTASGPRAVLRVARWDGTTSNWTNIGAGFDGPVNALGYFKGELYAGGAFAFSGVSPVGAIARLNAGSWVEVDAGIADKTPPEVFTLGADDSALYAGGRFLIAGTLTAYNLVAWTGTAWRTVGRRSRTASSSSGVDGGVFAMVVRGDDVYIGGDFTRAGGIETGHVAKWNAFDAEWTPLGAGIRGTSSFVRSMELVGDNLYVGGIFNEAGGIATEGIAQWNIPSQTWSGVGAGVGGPTPYVFALRQHQGDIYVAGAFTTAGGAEANRIAKWDGANWSPLGAGVRGDTVYVYVTSLAFLGNDLYAGGTFSSVADQPIPFLARWDGSAWNDVSGGVNAQVSALETINGKLYVGGDFSRAGGDTAHHVAVWDGNAWSALGTGTDGSVQTFAPGPDGSIYAGGDFRQAGGRTAANLALWDGSTWSAVGSGTNGPVRTLGTSSIDIYVGGEFSVAGGLKVNNIARFDGDGYSALGSDAASGLEGIVRAIAVKDSNIYIGGEFTSVGGIRAANLARWNGTNWSTIGRGRLNGVDGAVFALAAHDNDLFVGGTFRTAGGNNIPFIARWDGSGWSSLGSGLSGSSPFVFALLLEGDDLYVGGAFRYAGGLDVQKIARWRRSASSWSGLENGIGGGSYYTYVSAIARSGSDLYVGGNFTSAGTTPAANIARWDGTTWHSLEGYGTNGAVYQIIDDQKGGIYVGGNFTQAGNLRVGYVARWSVTGGWSALGSAMNRPVYDMAIIQGDLVAGGSFTVAGAYNSNGIARWKNGEWFPLGRGVTKKEDVGVVLTMITNPYDTSLWVGGDFTVAGGNPSYYVGRWAPSLGVAGITTMSEVSRASSTLSIAVAPNPTIDDRANVTISLGQMPPNRNLRVALHDLLGRQVALLHDASTEGNLLSIPLSTSGLPPGTYLLRASTDDDAVTIIVTAR